MEENKLAIMKAAIERRRAARAQVKSTAPPPPTTSTTKEVIESSSGDKRPREVISSNVEPPSKQSKIISSLPIVPTDSNVLKAEERRPKLRGTYRAYDAMDEITAALSVSFNSSGAKIFAGYDKYVRVFDIHRPGRDFEEYSLAKGDARPSGIVSSIAFSPTHSGILAVGSYSQTTAVYVEANMELLYVLHGQMGGVTQVQFSKDGNYIYTGGRKDPYILCWDIRNTIGVLYKLYRSSDSTNQRVSFDIEPSGRYLGTGGQDGIVHIYDLQSGEWMSGFQAASDTVNCFSFHPYVPLAASSSGNRRFILPDNFEESLSLNDNENCTSIWKFTGPTELEDDLPRTD